MSFFVNRRWVQSHLLAHALEEGYHGLIQAGNHPIAVLRMSLPYKDVDVNVHPTKSAVRFRRGERSSLSLKGRCERLSWGTCLCPC